MRRTIERKFEGMSPRERRREVLRMQRIERAARALLVGIHVIGVRRDSVVTKGANVTLPPRGGPWRDYGKLRYAKLRDLADALGMYEPTDVAKSKGETRRS